MVRPGLVLIAPGGMHMTFTANGKETAVAISPEPAGTLYRPSADVMMLSAVEAFRAPLLGLIMTGMGKDGLEGLKKIKRGEDTWSPRTKKPVSSTACPGRRWTRGSPMSSSRSTRSPRHSCESFRSEQAWTA